MPLFKIGDRVHHSDYSIGTVGWVGAEQIGVDFDRYGKVLLRLESVDLRAAIEDDERADVARVKDNDEISASQEPFFVLEGEEEEEKHSMGAHWVPFFDGARPVFNHLSELLSIAQLHSGYSEFFPSPTRAAVAWTRAALLLASGEALASCMGFEQRPHPWDHLTPWRSPGGALEETPERARGWSERNTGVAMVIALSESPGNANEFRSMFPYCLDGTEHEIVLNRVLVWKGAVEAQIEASFGGARVFFYDMDFVNNRDWYRRGGRYQFILVGLAYYATVSKIQTFRIQRTPEYLEGMAWLIGEDRRPGSSALEEAFSTEGMAMLLPVEGWDIDNYLFRGPVRDVWGMSMLGQHAWHVRVTVLRLSDREPEDVDLDIVITERAWKGDSPPRIGQEIEGHLWLQGRL